jgi:hypothetical protein
MGSSHDSSRCFCEPWLQKPPGEVRRRLPVMVMTFPGRAPLHSLQRAGPATPHASHVGLPGLALPVPQYQQWGVVKSCRWQWRGAGRSGAPHRAKRQVTGIRAGREGGAVGRTAVSAAKAGAVENMGARAGGRSVLVGQWVGTAERCDGGNASYAGQGLGSMGSLDSKGRQGAWVPWECTPGENGTSKGPQPMRDA